MTDMRGRAKERLFLQDFHELYYLFGIFNIHDAENEAASSAQPDLAVRYPESLASYSIRISTLLFSIHDCRGRTGELAREYPQIVWQMG